MEPEVSMSVKQVKNINKEILINGGDLDLYLDLFLTDEEGKVEKVLTKKADSILANFLRILFLQMGRDNRGGAMGGTFYKLRTTINSSGTYFISSITSGAGNVMRLTSGYSLVDVTIPTGIITLSGFQGINLEGIYTFTRVNDYNIDITGTVYSAGWVSGTGGGAIYVPVSYIGYPAGSSFISEGIIVGKGTGSVLIDNNCLNAQIPQGSSSGSLTYNASTVSQDTNDATSAQITFTRTFTNSSPGSIVVNEIGLLMRAGYDITTGGYNTLLTMRDLVSGGVTVVSGKTLTVNYRIKTILGTGTDPGGFLASFMRLLYRHAGQATRAVFDINNVSRTYGRNATTFLAVKNGGMGIELPGDAEVESGYRYGIVVGIGTASVSMGDFYLENPIMHGTGSNQMLYYGSFAENFTIGSSSAQFSLIKAIENNSGSGILIKEYVITGGAGIQITDLTDSYSSAYVHSLTRNTLTTPITVLNGEILKVNCTFKVIVV